MCLQLIETCSKLVLKIQQTERQCDELPKPGVKPVQIWCGLFPVNVHFAEICQLVAGNLILNTF